jgi:hypothetical protein
MKRKTHVLCFGFAALMYAAMFTLTACPSGSDGAGGGSIPSGGTWATSMTYTGTSSGKTVIVKIAKIAAEARAAVLAYVPANGDSYSVRYDGTIVDEGQIFVKGNTITCRSTKDRTKSFTMTKSTITSGTITPITITEGGVIGSVITITDVIIDDGTGRSRPRLTVNNLTGTFTAIEIFPNAPVPATQSAWNAIVATGRVALCDASDDNSSPFEAFTISPGKTFNPNGKYVVMVFTESGQRCQVDVQFTNGSATVNFSTMTDYFSLPE